MRVLDVLDRSRVGVDDHETLRVSGESANEKVSVEPAYHVRLETFWTAW